VNVLFIQIQSSLATSTQLPLICLSLRNQRTMSVKLNFTGIWTTLNLTQYWVMRNKKKNYQTALFRLEPQTVTPLCFSNKSSKFDYIFLKNELIDLLPPATFALALSLAVKLGVLAAIFISGLLRSSTLPPAGSLSSSSSFGFFDSWPVQERQPKMVT